MDTLFERELAKRLNKLTDERTKSLTHTVLPVDMYMQQMGYLKALRDVGDVCDAIRTDMKKGSI